MQPYNCLHWNYHRTPEMYSDYDLSVDPTYSTGKWMSYWKRMENNPQLVSYYPYLRTWRTNNRNLLQTTTATPITTRRVTNPGNSKPVDFITNPSTIKEAVTFFKGNKYKRGRNKFQQNKNYNSNNTSESSKFRKSWDKSGGKGWPTTVVSTCTCTHNCTTSSQHQYWNKTTDSRRETSPFLESVAKSSSERGSYKYSKIWSRMDIHKSSTNEKNTM